MRQCLFLFTLLIFSCRPSTNPITIEAPQPIDESLGRYISSYTNDKISIKEESIRLRFSKAQITEDVVGTEVNPELYSLKPNFKVKAFWVDRLTIEFSPKETLQSNTRYEIEIKLAEMYSDVPDKLKKATIPFVTKQNKLDIRFYSIHYDENMNLNNLSATGYINATDYIASAEVEKMLTVKQKGNNDVVVNWAHNPNRHHFTVNNIQRQKGDSQIDFTYNGQSIDANFKGSKVIRVTRIGTFEVSSVTAVEGSTRAVDVHFSQKLDLNQDFNGLISIKDYKGKYKYDVSSQKVRVFPQSKTRNLVEVEVFKGIKDIRKETLKSTKAYTVSFGPIKPLLRLSGKGVIVPSGEEVIFPFEAINLKSATVKVFKVFQDNVLQMLQYNRLSDTYSMAPVGRVVHTEKIDLSKVNPENNYEEFVRYALDLSSFTKLDPGAIYQITLEMSKDDVNAYPCKEDNEGGYYRDNPCKAAYYRSRRISQNVLASNIGIIAKRGVNNEVNLVVSDLKTIQAIPGASVAVYDFQQQQLATSSTDANGMVKLEDLGQKPAFVIVSTGSQYGYVNMQDQHAISNSEFEVSGQRIQSGINGFIYTDRGVWRPGDTIYLDFILEDRLSKLPDNHPVSIEVKDSRGKTKFKRTTSLHLGGIYDFVIPSKPVDPTGNWTAIIKVGNRNFRKTLKIETVKPNRLKIEFESQEDIKIYADQSIPLKAEWLHGASGAGLKAKVDLKLKSIRTSFKGYGDYNFDDPARKANAQRTTVFEGKLDENGKADILLDNKKKWQAPGKLSAQFNTKVYEKSGNFSEDNYSQEADLYASYVGIDIPKTRWGSKFIKIGKTVPIPIVVLDAEGKPIKNRNLSIGLYEAQWNWWYGRSYNNRYNYNSSEHKGAITKAKLKTDSRGKASYKVSFDQYANYMIRVCDDVSGHCTGDFFYTGRYWSQQNEKDGPQQLLFTTDKKSYNTGEEIKVSVPTNDGAKLLVSVEDGQKVLATYWVDTKEDQTDFYVPTNKYPGASTLYISAHLIQPHNNGENDLAMRMYGVIPVEVVNPSTQLAPKIGLPSKIRPGENFTLEVSEKKGVPMAYTVSIVDEGLLSLTRFKTPNPWSNFYAKLALGVKTWDIYDLVLNAYGGTIDQYISVGGDASGGALNNAKEANRFKPVVLHLGPYYLKAGETAKHQLKMPNYVGAVRTMVVARNANAYGNAEESTPVKKPLMVQSTLPRVLGPNESLAMPINVFAMEDQVKSVKTEIEVSDNLSIIGSPAKNLRFERIGDQLASFDLKVGNSIGPASIKASVSSGKEKSFENIDIQIRNPSPVTSKVTEASIQPGEKWSGSIKMHGSNGTNEARLEVSQIPPIDFGRRLRYLIRYPYGCVEQTTSSAFPQLYLDVVSELSPAKKRAIERNMRRAIDRLSTFQNSNGGLSYWAGNSGVSEYGSVYAAHFLLEAKNRGYNVHQEFIEKLMSYLDGRSNQFDNQKQKWARNTQAYRLYVLAKYGKANISAMNRFRTIDKHPNTSIFLLAAAYSLVGKKDIASQLIAQEDKEVEAYIETGYSYGSDTRDMAMIAEALAEMGKANESAQIIKQLSKRMSSRQWYSTQSTAYSLLAIGKYLEAFDGSDLSYDYEYNGEEYKGLTSSKPIAQHDLIVNGRQQGNVGVLNKTNAPLFVRVVSSGQLPPGEEEAAYQRHVSIETTFTDRSGKTIDPSRIAIGTDFTAVTTVKNLGSRVQHIDEVAVTQIFPSGWEIQNERLAGDATNQKFDYQDIRDDRVNTFFDLYGRKDKRVIKTLLTASYAGRYYMPPVSVEAMYDNEIQAKTSGKWVEVVNN